MRETIQERKREIMEPGSAEKTCEKEIEITPEMIEAGEGIIYSKLGSGLPAYLSGADLAMMVYSAMTRAAIK